MEKFTLWMEKNFLPVAQKIGAQKHLVAIRDAFIAILPLTMAGSIAVLLSVFTSDIPTILVGADSAAGFIEGTKFIRDITGAVQNGTLGILALVVVFTLGYNLSKADDVDALAGGLISTASFLALIPRLEGVIQGSYLGATGVFTALITGLFATTIYIKITKAKLVINMPEGVPPAVSRAFVAIIPGAVAIFTVAIINCIVTTFGGDSINNLINIYIAKPFMGLSQGLPAVIIYTLAVQILWFFGLHGSNILGAVNEGIYGVATIANSEAIAAGKALPYIWTKASNEAYVNFGGAGATLGLLIAIFIFSKRVEYKSIAKMSLPMGIFEINEPVIFGLPIVLNPIFFIPFILSTPILATVAYLVTQAGLVPPTFVPLPWIMPPVIGAFLATGGSFAAALLAAFNLFLAVCIYVPFVKMANKIEE